MKRLCVFCGSSPGSRPEYRRVAEALGHALVERGIGLVYGGGHVGMMGIIAETVFKNNGNVIGVIPEKLFKKEVGYTELSDLRVVGSMHERKALMAELSDGFIAMPGGLGTIEEFFEVLTWAQLGIHSKPCGVLNVNGFYDKMLEFLDHVAAEQFILKENRSMIIVETEPGILLDQFHDYRPPVVDKARWALSMKNS